MNKFIFFKAKYELKVKNSIFNKLCLMYIGNQYKDNYYKSLLLNHLNQIISRKNNLNKNNIIIFYYL